MYLAKYKELDYLVNEIPIFWLKRDWVWHTSKPQACRFIYKEENGAPEVVSSEATTTRIVDDNTAGQFWGFTINGEIQ